MIVKGDRVVVPSGPRDKSGPPVAGTVIDLIRGELWVQLDEPQPFGDHAYYSPEEVIEVVVGEDLVKGDE